jgi:hypothetical protein
MRKLVRMIVVSSACLVLAACNPLLSDPVSVGGELDQTAARYAGPPAAWTEVLVSGATEDDVFAFALVRDDARHGPAERSCAGPEDVAVPCDVTLHDVRMPNQRTVPGDASRYVRLMTVWPDETIDVVLVCVDRATNELGCPTSLRVALRTVDDGGARTGVLVPA